MHGTQPATKTTVSILTDSRLMRETIAAWFQLQREIGQVFAAASLHQLRQRLAGHSAGVLLAHTSSDGILAREARYDVRALLPATCLVVLESGRGEQDLARWIDAGAMAYLEHDTSLVDLLQTVLNIARGCPFAISPHTRPIGSRGRVICRSSTVLGRATAQPPDDREVEAAVLCAGQAPEKHIGRHRDALDFSSMPLHTDTSSTSPT